MAPVTDSQQGIARLVKLFERSTGLTPAGENRSVVQGVFDLAFRFVDMPLDLLCFAFGFHFMVIEGIARFFFDLASDLIVFAFSFILGT